jgi:hypothetical protein
MKNPKRARIVLSDDRNEFIRLRQTGNEREPGASGAPKGSLKFKKIQKPYAPKVHPILPEVQVESPASVGDKKKKKKKTSEVGGIKPKSAKKSRRAAANASLLSAENCVEPLDPETEADLADLATSDADVAEGGFDNAPAQSVSDPPGLAQALADAVDEYGLTFVEPASKLPAETRAHRHRNRHIILSKLLPTKDLGCFVSGVKSAAWDRWHLLPVVSSKIRKLVLKDLEDAFSV